MIYPVSESLERLMDSFVDGETGELLEWWRDPETGKIYPMSDELMESMIEKMQMDFEDKICDLRNQYINLTAEAEALKAEKAKLAKRQKAAENQAERAKRFIAWLLKGEKFQKDTVKISYRRSEEVVPEDGFIEWAEINHPELLKYSDPEPRKADIKAAIKNGMAIEHAHIETKNNIQVK